MKILILASEGQLSTALAPMAKAAGHEVVALAFEELDISDGRAVAAAVSKHRPTHIVNGAAYNFVDRAEDEPEAAFLANGMGPACLALAARRAGAILVHYSSDYVFDGAKTTDYTEEDSPNPLSIYGRSKLLGEQAVAAIWDKSYILRTAWVFAPGGNNFISRMLKQADAGAKLKFIDDRWCTPTYAADLAAATLALLDRKAPFGLYHAAGMESCTPYQWAKAVALRAGSKLAVEATKSGSYVTKAARPKRSIMANKKLSALGIQIPGGLSRLDDYFAAAGGG